MKKQFLVGMGALLCVSLFFLGCSIDDTSPRMPQSPQVVQITVGTAGTPEISAVKAVYKVEITTAIGSSEKNHLYKCGECSCFVQLPIGYGYRKCPGGGNSH